jgi:hypothetical protein
MRPDLAAWMRVPYRRGGRTLAAADCWGLVRIIRQAVRGDVLPLFAEVIGEDREEWTRVQSAFVATARPVERPVDGSIGFVANAQGLCVHCGIVLTIDGRQCVIDTGVKHGPRFQARKYFERLYQDVRYYD